MPPGVPHSLQDQIKSIVQSLCGSYDIVYDEKMVWYCMQDFNNPFRMPPFMIWNNTSGLVDYIHGRWVNKFYSTLKHGNYQKQKQRRLETILNAKVVL